MDTWSSLVGVWNRIVSLYGIVAPFHNNNTSLQVAARSQEPKPVKSQATESKPPMFSTRYHPAPSLPADHASKPDRETRQMPHYSRVKIPGPVEPCTHEHRSLPYESFSQQHQVTSVPPDGRPAMSMSHGLESAVPIKPPCVMASPQYLMTETNWVSSHTQTDSLGSEKEDNAQEAREGLDRECESVCPVVTVNVASQTSFHATDKGSPKDHSLEIAKPSVEVSKVEKSISASEGF